MITAQDLEQFYGTTTYRNYMGVLLTDGCAFLMNNGMHWLVSDVAIACKMNNKTNQPFIHVTFNKHADSSCTVTYDDGNGNILFDQKYGYTDAEIDKAQFYYVDNVLMLRSEY